MLKVQLMEKIAARVRVCVKCPLWESRTKAVPGEGNVDASVVFVGEAPGYWEDAKGVPFVGAAGKILDSQLEKTGLPRREVFITNVVKCRPPRNRPPRQLEVDTCTGLYLNQQIRLIKPKIIGTLGRYSTSYVLSKAGFEQVDSIGQLRGKTYEVRLLSCPVTVVPMYHPASVLHNPVYGDELDRDFQLLESELRKHGIV